MRLTPGRCLYLGYHLPRAWLARSRRAGGPWQQWVDARGRAAMRSAAARLPAMPAAPRGAPEVCFLTGRKFWYQTALCCWTLRRHCADPLQPVFIDDGTFDQKLGAEVVRVFPGATVELRYEIEARLDRALPTARFPALRGQRCSYLHLRKLTDAHAGRHGWRVVLDSDMLFFRPPTAFLQWLAEPRAPIHLIDVHESYGYPATTLAELATPAALPRQLNVGIAGLRSEALDWQRVESWCGELLRRHGTSYYLEQALVALCLSSSVPVRLPSDDYRVMPDDAECRAPRAVLHHYVDRSKRGYFRWAWRRALAAMSEA